MRRKKTENLSVKRDRSTEQGKLTVKKRGPIGRPSLTVRSKLSKLQKHILMTVLEWPERYKTKGFWFPEPTRREVALDYVPWGYKRGPKGWWPKMGNKASVSMSRAIKRLKERGLIIEQKVRPEGYHYSLPALALTEPGREKAKQLRAES